MSSNIAQFVQQINEGVARFNDEQAPLVVRKVALQILAGAVLATPVETGRARGGWQVDLDRTNEDAGDSIDNLGGATIAKGNAALGRFNLGQTVHIFNNVAYIGVLERGRHIDENGHTRGSIQAPQGMLGIALANVAAQFDTGGQP